MTEFHQGWVLNPLRKEEDLGNLGFPQIPDSPPHVTLEMADINLDVRLSCDFDLSC